MKKVVPILSILAGLYWVSRGFAYGFWVRNGPGGGFLPIVGGVVVIVFSVLLLWAGRRGKTSEEFAWTALIPVAALLGMVLFSYLVGMIISLTAYVFIWLRFAEQRKLGSSLMISIGTTAVIYGIFVAWLNVPMPKGLLGLF